MKAYGLPHEVLRPEKGDFEEEGIIFWLYAEAL
jgi:hypothetical protein